MNVKTVVLQLVCFCRREKFESLTSKFLIYVSVDFPKKAMHEVHIESFTYNYTFSQIYENPLI